MVPSKYVKIYFVFCEFHWIINHLAALLNHIFPVSSFGTYNSNFSNLFIVNLWTKQNMANNVII